MHLLFSLCFLVCVSAGPYGCNGQQNLQPIYTNPPTFVKSVPNGKLYTTGSVEPKIAVVHVYGTPYQMGYAHGQLTKENSIELYTDVLQYIEDQVAQAIDFLPKFLADLIAEYGIEAGLELTYWMTEAYIPPYFLEELKGFSDATGIDYMTVVQVHMFPEIIKAHCSMVGAWGPATMNSNSSGKLVQLRALDWATNGPFQKFPQVLVYHPSDPRSQPFAIFGFVGFIGAMSGISSTPLGICEKVWLAYNGTSSRSGIPWHFMLRDILQFDRTVDDAINRVNHAARTCSIWIGVGEPTNKFRVMSYAYEAVTVYDDQNYPVYQNHPRLNGVVYVNKHVQPSTDPCLGTMLQQNYGKIDAQFLIQSVVALHETGDTHAAVYDYGGDALYVSTAGIYTKAHGAVPAYKRPWTKLTMSALWAVQPDPLE